MGHSHLYFSFNTLLMPQWIKIQSLLEINNTQNIQRILECFTVRVLTTSSGSTWTNVPTVAASQMTQRGLRPRSNHIHECFLVSWIVTLTLSHLAWTPRQGEELLSVLECIPDWTVSHATMQYHSTPAEGATVNTWSNVSIQYCLWLQIERYVQRRRKNFLKSTCLFFFFFQPYNLT